MTTVVWRGLIWASGLHAMRSKTGLDPQRETEMKRATIRHAGTLLFSVCVLACSLALAAEKDGSGGDTAREKRSSAGRDQGSQKSARKPAGTFKPTEKIGADSAVSFPVDI